MEHEHKIFFDLSVLLKKDDLKIRQFADRSVLSAGAYFNLLNRFIKLAPYVLRDLKRFVNRDIDRHTHKSLDEMVVLLKNMGYRNGYISEIYFILGAYEKGNWRLAGHHAEGVIESFNELNLRVMAAKRLDKPENLPDISLPLKDFIMRLDMEEENRKPVILAVDDSPVILKSVSSVLSMAYKVFMLPKPTELEKVLQKLTPELFLLDYQMPEINGFDLIPVIRSFDKHQDTPIVFLTSIGTIDNISAALALGACDFLVKPFQPDVLREKIANHIGKKKQRAIS